MALKTAKDLEEESVIDQNEEMELEEKEEVYTKLSDIEDEGVKIIKKAVLPEKDVFVFESAPMGNSSVGFFDGEKTKQLNLIDKQYTVDDSIQGHDRFVLMNTLKKAGFVHKESLNKSVEKEVQVKNEWVVGHPDNGVADRITCNLVVELKDKSVQIEVVDGSVRVRNKEVYEKLLDMGFYLIDEKELEEPVS